MSGKQGRWRMPRAGLTTDRVVAAAADLADATGFDNVTVSALARHFGVKDASLYTHVRNLRELRVRVALLAGGELIDEIAAAVKELMEGEKGSAVRRQAGILQEAAARAWSPEGSSRRALEEVAVKWKAALRRQK